MKIILSLAFIFIAISAIAQTPIIKEDFSKNNFGWEQSLTKTFTNGAYIINSTEDGEQSSINFFIDSEKDFTISADFIQQDGLSDNGFGLMWGSSKNDFNLFIISADGDFAVFSGDPSELRNWERAKEIKPIGSLNQLKVESKNGTTNFYINNVKVDERKNFQLYGATMGFIAFTKMKLQVDNFLFEQDQTIDLPSGNFTTKKENIGPAINTSEDELGPIISSDGKTILFARQNVEGNIGGRNDDEDVWISEWQDGKWSKASNMGAEVNTPRADNLLALSTDKNTLMFLYGNQLMVRHRTETGWSSLEKLGLNFKNELDHFVATLTADGKALIFSAKLKYNIYYDSKTEDGDLYVCLKNDDIWSPPINLGKNINTPFEETSPFLSADGKTLFFSSNGRPGYGDQDIFVSRRQNQSWTDWSKPINLGPAINSEYFDAYYTVPASGDYAYFVSYDKGFGKADIFRIRLSENMKPKAVALIRGKVLNSKNSFPLSAAIRFENLETGEEIGEAMADPKTGAYQLVLPLGLNYGVHAQSSGFYSVNENLELKASENYSEVSKDLMMIPIEIGETIKLNNVFFNAGQPSLMQESFPELDRLVEILKDNSSIFIQIEGHTDNLGKEEVLQKLSEDRAESVKQYLVSHGIESKRITSIGFGATKPLMTGTTEEDRKQNRRVDIKILKK